MTDGIYILANDVVVDQLIALVNSVRKNSKKNYPICVIPYDDRLQKTRQYVDSKNNVELLEDESLINRWEKFSTQIWERHPTAIAHWQAKGIEGVNRMGMHRRFCAFEGPFERYIYLDADTLAVGDLDNIFKHLDSFDWVVYDFQYKDVSHVFNTDSPILEKLFSAEQLASIFCAGMYASKLGLFTQEQLDWLLQELEQEADVLYSNGPDQSIVNYMTLKLDIQICNLSKHLSTDEVTGCCVTSSHFQEMGDQVLDKGTPLTYLHYIGISSKVFARVCGGENVDFPYRETFLHYRYLDNPSERPALDGELVSLKPVPPSFQKKVLKKLGLVK